MAVEYDVDSMINAGPTIYVIFVMSVFGIAWGFYNSMVVNKIHLEE
jgi:hypothetical protein